MTDHDAAGLVIRDRRDVCISREAAETIRRVCIVSDHQRTGRVRNILNTAIAASPEGDEVLAVTDPEFPSMLYGWTDDDGIYRFTDDPSQVPGSFDPTATPEGMVTISVEDAEYLDGLAYHAWGEHFDADDKSSDTKLWHDVVKRLRAAIARAEGDCARP